MSKKLTTASINQKWKRVFDLVQGAVRRGIDPEVVTNEIVLAMEGFSQEDGDKMQKDYIPPSL